MTASRSRVTTVPRPVRFAVAIAAAMLVAAAAGAGAGFRESSLFGTFAAVGAGDGHTSASVGTVTYDGAGNVTRSLVVNAPDGSGGRRLLTFESTGIYEIHADGTGVVYLVNQIGNDTTTEVTFDFVVQESQLKAKGGRRVTRLFGVQREPGTTVNLVTTTETLIAP